MPITHHKLGPGVLTLGAGALAVQQQLTGCKITPSEAVTTTDRKKVLSGEVLEGSSSAEYTYVLEGTMLQDLVAAGVVAWSWDEAGMEHPFSFTPNTAADATFTGVIVPVPLQVGGDEVDGPDMEASFTWRCIGTPVPTWA